MSKIIHKNKKSFQPKRIVLILLFYINSYIASKMAKKYPQVGTFVFDYTSQVINLYGRLSNEDLTLIMSYLSKNFKSFEKRNVIDVGANIGNHSIFFSDYFEKVYAYEPYPPIFELLKFNSKFVCKRQNIYPKMIGLSDKKKSLKFEVNFSHFGQSKIIDNKINSKNLISINVDKLDNIYKDINKVELIKIDVEGHELMVLKGAKQIIKKNKPYILFEQHIKEITNGSSKSIDFLKSLGYRFAAVEKNLYFGNSLFGRIVSSILRLFSGHRLQLVETNNFKKIFYNNILAIPKNKYHEFINYS